MIAVGWSAWLGLAVSHTDLLLIGFSAAMIGALIYPYFRPGLIEQRLGMWLYIDQFTRAFVAIWTLISFGFFLLEVAKLRLHIIYLRRKFRILSEKNRNPVAKHREMLGLDCGRAVLGDELFDEVKRVHGPNEKEISHGRVSWQAR